MNKIVFYFYTCLLFLACAHAVKATTIGSQTTASKQAFTTLLPNVDNEIIGFAWMASGFALTDKTTSCSFRSVFPVSGNIYFSGGKFYLQEDLFFDNPFKIFSPGTIYGNGHSIIFPSGSATITIPDFVSETTSFGQLLQEDTTKAINDLDWSYDDNYLAIAPSSDNQKVDLYYFDGASLTNTAVSPSLNATVYSTRFHPSSYYVAAGQDGTSGNEVRIYLWDMSNGTFSLTGGYEVGQQVRALSWHKSGDYLALGAKSGTNEIRLYQFAGGTLSNEVTVDLPQNRHISINAMDWDPTGSYLAIGTAKDPTIGASELLIYHFMTQPSLSLTLTVETNIDELVRAVSWSPTHSYIAVGLSSVSASELLRIYHHNSETYALTEQVAARVGQAYDVLTLDWDSNGQFLVMGEKLGSGVGCQVFEVNPTTTTLTLLSSFPTTNDVNAVRWSHNDSYFARGDKNKESRLFKKCGLAAESFTFDTVTLAFDSDVTIKAPIVFQGNCIINGNGHVLDIGQTASIEIASNASLCLSNVMVKGIAATNISCVDNTATLTIQNVQWILSSDVTFGAGRIDILDDFDLFGTATLAYQSSKPITIKKNARLLLNDGITFSYDAAGGDDKFIFEDASSILVLKGASFHVTATGLQCKKGKIRIKKESVFSSDTASDITLGNNLTTAADDCCLEIADGSLLTITKGLNIKNLSATACKMRDASSVLKIGTGATLKLFEDLDIGEGVVKFEDGSTLSRKNGIEFMGGVSAEGSITYERFA